MPTGLRPTGRRAVLRSRRLWQQVIVGDPYIRVFLHDGVLAPGQSIHPTLMFERHSRSFDAAPVRYSIELLSGQGKP
jgi:hypothetical protein